MVLSLLVALVLQPDPLLAGLRAPDGEAPNCSSTFTVESVQGEERDRRVYRYDAATGESEMIEGSPEAMKAHAERKAEEAREAEEAEASSGEEDDEESGTVSFGMVPYADAIRTDGLDFARSGTEDGLVVFRAGPPLPKGTFEASGRDMSKRSAATLWIEPGETPRLRRHAYALEKEFRVPMIARVRTLEQVTEYELVEGRMTPVRFRITFDADVMGKTQAGETRMSLGDFDCGVGTGD